MTAKTDLKVVVFMISKYRIFLKGLFVLNGFLKGNFTV